MVGEVRRDGDDGGAAERQEELAEALQEAYRLLHAATGGEPAEAWSPLLERLTGIETALREHGENFFVVFVFVGLVLGMRRLHGGEHASSGSGARERAEALRRLRWADRNGPVDDLLVVQARMLLVFLLVPWALPRADGTDTVLRSALLTPGYGEELLTESVRRDLVEAKEIVDRIAAAPIGAEFEQGTANVKRVIERMLAPGTTLFDTPSPAPAGTAAAGGADAAGARTAVPGGGRPVDALDDPEAALLDAVRGLVALAGARSTATFTRILLWMLTTLRSGTGDHPYEELRLDPEAAALLRRAAVGGAAGADGLRGAADLALRSLHALPPDAPERARVARLHAWLLVHVETLEPGSVDFRAAERPVPPAESDRGSRLRDWPAGLALEPGLVAHLDGPLRDFSAELGVRERRYAARIDRLLAYRTGDTGYLEDAAVLLTEAIDLSRDSWWATALRAELAEIQEQAASYGGSFHDADSSLATLRELGTALRHDGSLPLDAPFALDLLLSTVDRELGHARRTGNHEALPRLVEELRARHAALPVDSDRRGAVAERLEQIEELGSGGQRQAAGEAGPAVDLAAELEDLKRTVAEITRDLDAPALYHHHEYDRRVTLGMRLLLSVRRGLTAPVLLDCAIGQLARARTLLAEGRGGGRRVDVLTQLAEAHLMRASRRGPHTAADERAFLEITHEALDELAADVLLQTGADHGLSAALNGDLLAERLAWAALLLRRPADAVAGLEKGRALVHQAATASWSIPELLDAAGHPELARRWRTRIPADPLRPRTGDASAPAAATPPIPSALRRDALAALGVRPRPGQGRRARQVVGAADVAALTEGLAASGADALVYLLPGLPLPPTGGSYPGHALILRPGAEPVMLPLPELIRPGSAPLERYLKAAVARSRALVHPTMHTSYRAAFELDWQAALRALCDWAWPAVMGPVLSAVRSAPGARVPPDRPPRLVLVPCGRISVVPWHAARTGGAGGHGHRYACQEAVISYAPSGTQFLAAAGRRRMPPAEGRQVLVADPELTLPWAEVETAALYASCYPGALRYGEFLDTGEEPDAAGTPADLLAVLPGGASPASVVHLACHAWAAPRPTESALRLAVAPGAGRDSGRLTVAGLLDGAAGPRPDTAGPLVVLSACETDLSTRHHDESLTLATALITRGAADVVGSRWAVRDGPTAVMMAVFHHHLTAGGLAPPDALRAAQLWMLDPHRRLPFDLDEPLRHEAARSDLHGLHHWAAFTHQGNPAPAPTG
ncbi:hypothetical protein GCM10010300_37560 [Streptomyces olivaceoviridis]|uniref:CHAT domain-containing protein n=1 Tax=Streptomyces olivaceoviridis TaxID=1921 RepID=UPI00167705AA|nr:CHAT domain-containing protein [Streptomyces olivaceoviridis]GGY89847.1 hypothetical protein GCM10010300_37560 [Streptomyces olivaceoviridis]